MVVLVVRTDALAWRRGGLAAGEFLNQSGAAGQVGGAEFDDGPVAGAFAEAVADDAVAAEAGAHVKCGTVHVDRQVAVGDREVGDGDGRGTVGWRHGDLGCGVEAVFLKQTEKAEFQRRADTGGECLQPGAGGVGVASFERHGLRCGFR